ncbi:MAG: hypothetical protein NC911_00325 [Candidatus Omnitrophica bacterium]|nr:hypothetical protein [Candidatus Omnitrophota bacterium]
MFLQRKFLGIVVGKYNLSAVESIWQKGQGYLTRSAVWQFPANGSFNVSLGQQLGKFLRQNRFSTRKAVVGLPGSWLIVREKIVPPTDLITTAKLVNLEAKKDFAIPSDELCLDFISTNLPNNQTHLLVIGVLKKRLKEIEDFLSSAGLRPIAIVPAFLGLTNLVEKTQESLGLYLNAEEIALVRFFGGVIHSFYRFPVATRPAEGTSFDSWKKFLVSGLDRGLLLFSGLQATEKLVVFDDYGLPECLWPSLKEILGRRIELIKNYQPYSLAIGLAGLPAEPAINFLHPKTLIQEKKPGRRYTRPLVSSLAAMLLIVAAIHWSITQVEKNLGEIRQQVNQLRQETEEARKIQAGLQAVQLWRNSQPRMLDCLREITLCFPEDGGIWTTSLAIQPERGGTLIGKAENETQVLGLLGRLKEGKTFSEVNLVYLRQSSSQSKQVAYAISFTFPQPAGPITRTKNR